MGKRGEGDAPPPPRRQLPRRFQLESLDPERDELAFFWDLDWEQRPEDGSLTERQSARQSGDETEQTCYCDKQYDGADCSQLRGRYLSIQARSQVIIPEGAKSYAMKSTRQGSNIGELLYPK